MTSKTLPLYLVKKLENEGIQKWIKKIEDDFGLLVEHSKDCIKLTSSQSDILDIAVRTLEYKLSDPLENEHVLKILEHKRVVYKYYEEEGTKLKHFFEHEITKLDKVSTKLTNAPLVYSVSWPYETNFANQKAMEEIETKMSELQEDTVIVKTAAQKAKLCQFVQQRGPESKMKVLCLDGGGRKLRIIGCSCEDIEETKRDFEGTDTRKRTVIPVKATAQREPKAAKDSGKNPPVPNRTTQGKSISQGESSMHNIGTKSFRASETESDKLTESKRPQMSGNGSSRSTVNPQGVDDRRREGSDGPSKNTVIDGSTLRKPSQNHYHFVCESLSVFVYQESITEILGMDAIVNAANNRLMHGGGVASFISKAAGPSMDKECRAYIDKNGHIEVTENCVTSAGNMKCDKIIHAVGPQWYDYRSQEDRCAEDLCKTIINILRTAEKEKLQKIALSAISSGIYGVPKPLCAQMYVKSLVDYGEKCPGGYLKEVHFIDINIEILKMVEDAHKRWENDHGCLQFKNAFQFVGGNLAGGFSRQSPVKEGITVIFGGKSCSPFAQEVWTYHVGSAIVKIYNGNITALKDIEAIVCPVGPNFRGGNLASHIEKHGGWKYNSKVKELERIRPSPKDGEVYLCPVDGSFSFRKVLLVHMTHKITSATATELDRVKTGILNVLSLSDSNGIRTLAIPQIGAGMLQNNDDLKKLVDATINGIVHIAEVLGPLYTVREIHLVNLDKKVTSTVQSCMRARSEIRKREPQGAAEVEHSVTVPGHSDTFRLDKDNHGFSNKSVGKFDVPQVKPVQTDGGVDTNVTRIESITSAPCSSEMPTLSVTCLFEGCGRRAENELECGHAFCKTCFIPMKKNKLCPICLKSPKATPDTPGKKASNTEPSEDEHCAICMSKLTNSKLLACGHKFCCDCISEAMKYKPACPICGTMFGVITGNQPNGRMDTLKNGSIRLPGYEHYGAIVISYDFPNGKQGPDHPNPGRWYKGTRRVAYLPDSTEGNRVLRLLKKAWDNRLIFTIGESRTTGAEDTVTWNDIHHKTKIDGGPSNFGYPDPTYLQRVTEELAAKGIVE